MLQEALRKLAGDYKAQASAEDQRANEQAQRSPENPEIPTHRKLAKVNRQTAEALLSLGLQHQINEERAMSPWMKDWPDERVIAHIREAEETEAKIIREM